jgi:hypothetical protein
VNGRVRSASPRSGCGRTNRAQNLSWQQAFQRELDVANEVISAAFGVKLVADMRAWSYAAPTGAGLTDVLTAVQEHDPGDDVLTVIALTSSLSLVSQTFDMLGLANTPGRHMVLRGFADREERRAWDPFFTEISGEERKQLYAARRQHKTTALLLHELAHNLGSHHVANDDTLMSATYSHTATSFDRDSRGTVQAALDRHLKRAPRPNARPAVAPAGGKPKPLVIVVEDDGRRLVHGAVITSTLLDGRLGMAAEDHVEVIVQARRTAPQKVVTEIVDRARAAGLAVSVETIE